jgi:hypothetical protein
MDRIGCCENLREMRFIGAHFLSPETALTACRDRGSRKSVGALREAAKTCAAPRPSAERRVAAVLL